MQRKVIPLAYQILRGKIVLFLGIRRMLLLLLGVPLWARYPLIFLSVQVKDAAAIITQHQISL